MKLSILITLLSALFTFQQPAEVYYVVHIKGEIINETTNKPLQLQDRLKPSDKLTLKTPDAKAVIYSSSKGRFVLSHATLSQAKKSSVPLNEYIELVKDVLLPVNTIERLSTRSLDLKGVEDLEEFFGIHAYAFLGEGYKIRVSASSYPMSGGKYFVYKYTYKGQEYSKRIENTKDTLVFNKQALYTVQGTVIEPEAAGRAEIYYFNAKTSPIRITTIIPVFVPEDELKEEMRAMLHILKNEKLDREQILQKLHEHVETTYGNTHRFTFNEWASQFLSI
jgi:hypothetical protein